MTARTGRELAALTADLLAVQPQAKDLVRIDQRFGDVSRTSHWVASLPGADRRAVTCGAA